MKNLKQVLFSSFCLGRLLMPLHADEMTGGQFILTKDLLGASGSASIASADFEMRFSMEEPASGEVSTAAPYDFMSGYQAASFGAGVALSVLSMHIGQPEQPTFFQDGIQVGVALDAPLTIRFSDQLDERTLSNGIQAIVVRDHEGLTGYATAAFTLTHDLAHHSITITPLNTWAGNTLYDLMLSQQIRSVDDMPLELPVHVSFLTLLNPHENNVVLSPSPAGVLGVQELSSPPITVHIPRGSLSEYFVVLTGRDPQSSPMRVNPGIIQEANTKAAQEGGAYRTPLSVQEIVAYNAQGKALGPLAQRAEISLSYNTSAASWPMVVRPHTLSWWALDEVHKLWVKLPASKPIAAVQSIAAPVTRFAVFALMGSPDGSAADSFAFPVPWRPYGPLAGSSPGQSGTEAGGITFSNLPSECSIKIFSLAGELVRELQHSDLGGLLAQENWDVRTTHGKPVASGVYLWQISSSVDTKTGKLLVIR